MNQSSRKVRIMVAVIIGFLGSLVIRTFFLDGFIVVGDSMAPAIQHGDYVFISKRAYSSREPVRGEVVVAQTREDNLRVVKRIIGMPGERFAIENDQVVIKVSRLDPGQIISEGYLNGATTTARGITLITLDPREYFALGDNRAVSLDSRDFGPVDIWDLKGRVFAVVRLNPLRFIKF